MVMRAAGVSRIAPGRTPRLKILHGQKTRPKKEHAMRKLLGGLGLALALGAAQQAPAQDPFDDAVPIRTGPAFSEVPEDPKQWEAPIIQSAQANRPYNETPLKSRAQNAYVRANRTPAQEHIHKRAVFEAKQRTARMEHRKWRGESLLRPDNRIEHSWWNEYTFPVWVSSPH
jgi:hypothetical protein